MKLAHGINMTSKKNNQPVLYKKITVPQEFLVREEIEGEIFNYAGDVRIGDLTNDGEVDFLVYRCAENGMKPCFLGAFNMNGEPIWSDGEGGNQPLRPGAVAIHDLDGDGNTEVICLFQEPTENSNPNSMYNVVLQLRDGKTGKIKKQSTCSELRNCRGEGSNWVHQRILIANFRGNSTPRDFVIKLDNTVLAYDQNLKLLWKYIHPHARPAYIPTVGDIDGDGRDEVNGGYFLLNYDGKVLWEKDWAKNMDSVAIDSWDDGNIRAICSGGGYVIDDAGKVIFNLGEETVPHGQEVRVANFLAEYPGNEMIIRYNGHSPEVLVVSSHTSKVVCRFSLNSTPNNTGMESVYWFGQDKPALLCNGEMLWRGNGELFAKLPGLPELIKPPFIFGYPGFNMGWFHCIPVDIYDNECEELIIYNPWDPQIFIYTQKDMEESDHKGYQPGFRQYNCRLMD